MRRLASQLSARCSAQFLHNFSLERLTLHEISFAQFSCLDTTFAHDALFHFLAQESVLTRATLGRTSQQAND